MILSVSRYVADKEEQRRQEALQTNDEKLQAAAQALVLQAREMIQTEEETASPVIQSEAKNLGSIAQPESEC